MRARGAERVTDQRLGRGDRRKASPGGRSSAAAHARTSRGSAPVAVRWPLIASTCVRRDAGVGQRGADAAPHAVGIRRGHAAAARGGRRSSPRRPSTSARMRAPRARALSRLSSSSTPAPAAGHEAGGRGAHRPRGALGRVVRAARQHAHGVEPRPDVVARALRAAAEHALGAAAADALAARRRSPRCRCCRRSSWS